MARTQGVDLERRDARPEYALFQAVVDRIIQDIRNPQPLPPSAKKTGARCTTTHQLAAIEALADPQGGVSQWAGLLGLDPDWIREQLMVLAGLSDAEPRLGAYDFHTGETDELPGRSSG
jgi:hypothetical protein